jgi:hypothetical protein
VKLGRDERGDNLQKLNLGFCIAGEEKIPPLELHCPDYVSPHLFASHAFHHVGSSHCTAKTRWQLCVELVDYLVRASGRTVRSCLAGPETPMQRYRQSRYRTGASFQSFARCLDCTNKLLGLVRDLRPPQLVVVKHFLWSPR